MCVCLHRTSKLDEEQEIIEPDIDIDAEFESLLNKTFEKESRRLMTAEESEKVPGQRRRSRDEKAAKQSSREDSAGSQTRRGGRGTVSLDMSNAHTAAHFQQQTVKSGGIAFVAQPLRTEFSSTSTIKPTKVIL